jgi:uncharacterized membrane protein (DUF485 family)
MHDAESFTALRATIVRSRARVVATLTALMVGVYFGFIALVGWAPVWLGTRIGSGLSIGIVMGALVIVTAWLLTWIYVRWANSHYDRLLSELREQLARAPDLHASRIALPDGASRA